MFKYKNIFHRLKAVLLSPVTIAIVPSLGIALGSVLMGQDFNFDVLNYHYYNGYALLNGLENFNIGAAQNQTFLNPTLDALYYLMISHLSPICAQLLFAFFHGLNFFLVYLLARQILSRVYFASISETMKSVIALLCAVAGVTAPMFLSEIGTTFSDSFTSVFVIAALLLVFKEPTKRPWMYPLFGGFLIGVAVGLKLSNVIFLVAVIICGWWYKRNLRQSLKTLGIFIGGAAIAILAFQGYWSWHLWTQYGNPLFPAFNNIFQSPYAYPVSYTDARFIPDSFGDALSYPFQWVLGLHPSAELVFRDLRFALITILVVLCIILISIRVIRHRDSNKGAINIRFLLFFVISFCLWIYIFGIQRYIVVLELLSGIITFMLVTAIIGIRKYLIPVFACFVIIVAATTIPPHWARTYWSDDWFGVTVPNELMSDNQMVLMLGSDPTSFIIPWFPSDTRFVRIDGNFRPSPQIKFYEIIQKIIEDHQGPFYALCTKAPDERQIELLASYGLSLKQADSYLVTTKTSMKIDIYQLCRISTDVVPDQ